MAPRVMHIVSGVPLKANSRLKDPCASKTCTRLLPASSTKTSPALSMAMALAPLNWPWPAPVEPHWLMKWPNLSVLTTRLLAPIPSVT